MTKRDKALRKLVKEKNEAFKSTGLQLSPLELKINAIVLGDYPLSHLEKYKSHRRLKVFYHKGTTCVSCGIKGVRLIKRIYNNSLHTDVYTADLTLMTVDHIIPKSMGGDNSLANLRPMCRKCNYDRGNMVTVEEVQGVLGFTIE